jgi:hypothetical protein
MRGFSVTFILWFSVVLMGAFAPARPAVAASIPSVEEILRRMSERSQETRPSEPHGYYLCTKQTVTEELDRSGRVTNRKVKTGESKSNPNGSDAHKWGSQNGVQFSQELLQRFRFTLDRREVIDGRSTFVVSFLPKNPPAPVRQLQDRVLNRATGVLWVDEEDYELAKANITLIEPVGFGILGAVEALRFGFERARTPEGGWLTRWTDTSFKGRKFLIPVQFRKRVDCTDFRKLPKPE